MTVSTTINRKEVTCDATTATFSFPYVTFSASDIKVYRNGTLQTQADPNKYSVTLDPSNNHATITFQNSGTDYRPVSGDKIIIVREVATTQTTNYVNNSIFDAETLERSIDLEAIKSQQLTAKGDRAIKFADDVFGVTSTTTDLTTGGTDLNNKILGFNNDGNITATVELGTNRGNWASGSTYVLRDLVKQNNASDSATYGNIYICKVVHTAGGSHVTDQDSAKWDLIVDVASSSTNATTATNKALHASRSEDNAEAYAQTAENTQTTVYADVTSSSTSNDGYSALHHREKSKEYAQTVDAQVTNDSGTANQGYSSKEWAVGKDSGNTDGSSKQWALGGGASFASGTAVSGSDYSAKEHAVGTTVTTGSSKQWATKDTSAVASSLYSAKEYASGDATASGGSAKAWAEDSSSPDGTSTKSAKTWATEASGSASTASTQAGNASTSATNASASEVSARNSAAAVASALDSFDDKYLGTMSDSSTQVTNPTPTGTWAKDSSSITVSSGANIKVGQVVTGTGMPSPPPNVLSVTGSGSSETVVVSASMASAGSSVSLTFTGYGVYGTYNGTKDGPTSDNDNGSLADGMLYFNTTDNQMMVYKTTGAKWIPASSTGSTSLVVHKFTASGSETSVSASSFSPTLTYTPANIIVFLNGVRLDATDYTATNGNDITGLSALSASDEVVVYAFKSFEVADAVSATSGGTFSGNVAYTGNIQVDDIIEKTSAHGVEIDGVLVKDGDVGVATISSKAGTSVGVTLGTDSGDDFNVGSGKFVVEGDTGNVGIGNTAPEADLHIGSYQSGSGTTATLRLSEGNGSGASTGFDVKYVGSSDNLIFNSKDGSGNFADRMTINRDTGNVTISTGNVVIGTAGKGIDFSAQTQSTVYTASSEILDHYEEGSWTPTFLGQGSEPTQSYHHQVGRYTRIGNICYIQCNVEFSASGISAGSGNLILGGLPFNCANVSLLSPAGVVARQGGISVLGPKSIVGEINNNQANFTCVTDTSTTYVSAANIGNGAFVYASLVYTVD